MHIRETVPDTFLKQADQIVNLDLAIEDLIDRLRSGKIYAPEKITQALENFFQHQNLSTLRELALREVAESVDRTAVAAQPRRRRTCAVDSDSRVMVSHGVELAAGQRAAAARVAPGRPAEHRLVRRLRGNARRGAAPDRFRNAAALARHDPKGAKSWGPRWCGSGQAIRWRRCSISPARTTWATS